MTFCSIDTHRLPINLSAACRLDMRPLHLSGMPLEHARPHRSGIPLEYESSHLSGLHFIERIFAEYPSGLPLERPKRLAAQYPSGLPLSTSAVRRLP